MSERERELNLALIPAVRMPVNLLGITHRLRVIRWYQKNLHNPRAVYKPIIKW